MMKKMAAGGGMPGMPGMPGMGGGGGARKGAKSRAQEEGPLRQPGQGRAGTARTPRPGVPPAPRPFRPAPSFGQQGGDFDPSQLNLPKGFDKFLGGGK